MPVKSKKQEQFMQAVAHSPKFAKKVGVSKAVADKFVGPKAHKADGGEMRSSSKRRPGEGVPSPRRPEEVVSSPRRTYRTPTAAESRKLEESRQFMQRGIRGEKDMLSRLAPAMAKSARDDIRYAKTLREQVPPSAREGEAYNQAGYARGGSVDRVGRAVAPDRRDPDIGKLVKEHKPPAVGEGSFPIKKAAGGAVLTAGSGSGVGRMQKARKVR